MLFLVFREGTGELVQAAGPAVGGMFIASWPPDTGPEVLNGDCA